MSEALRVEFFLEDSAHEKLIVPLAEQIARKEELDIQCQLRNARGGHAGAMRSFESYQVVRAKGLEGRGLPDVLIVAIDGNCSSFTETRKQILRATHAPFVHMLVTACPDPHIERWYLADPESFQTVVGTRPKVGPTKCARGHYKRLLTDAVRHAGHPTTLRGIEFGQDLAEAMDLFRAGKNDSSLKAFIGDLRDALRRASQTKG